MPKWNCGRSIEDQQRLCKLIDPHHKDLASSIWWNGGKDYPQYYKIVRASKKTLPIYLSDSDPIVQVIAKWKYAILNKGVSNG